MKTKLLEIKNLKTYFFVEEGIIQAVDGISFDIFKGETLGLVGESGCGKSVTAHSILRLISGPPGKIENGKILFEGEDLITLPMKRMRKIRGYKIGIVFQEPMTSLNPVFTIGNQVMESVKEHLKKNRKEAREMTVEILKKVGIPSPEKRFNDYPHTMSGGMLQRVLIAMAIVCKPLLLIADEPTTALDVTIQAQIVELLQSLQEEYHLSILFITHDLGIVAEVSQRVVVMYAGKIIEIAEVKELFANPKHPYTEGLLNSVPSLDSTDKKLTPISGTVPSPLDFPKGCRFHPRCLYAMDICNKSEPALKEVFSDHRAACWLNEKEKTQGPIKGFG